MPDLLTHVLEVLFHYLDSFSIVSQCIRGQCNIFLQPLVQEIFRQEEFAAAKHERNVSFREGIAVSVHNYARQEAPTAGNWCRWKATSAVESQTMTASGGTRDVEEKRNQRVAG